MHSKLKQDLNLDSIDSASATLEIEDLLHVEITEDEMLDMVTVKDFSNTVCNALKISTEYVPSSSSGILLVVTLTGPSCSGKSTAERILSDMEV